MIIHTYNFLGHDHVSLISEICDTKFILEDHIVKYVRIKFIFINKKLNKEKRGIN